MSRRNQEENNESGCCRKTLMRTWTQRGASKTCAKKFRSWQAYGEAPLQKSRWNAEQDFFHFRSQIKFDWVALLAQTPHLHYLLVVLCSLVKTHDTQALAPVDLLQRISAYFETQCISKYSHSAHSAVMWIDSLLQLLL